MPARDLVLEGDDLVRVAGVSHYQPAILAAAGAEPGAEARVEARAELAPDPANEHDPNAVAVKIGGALVGYLPRDEASRWQPVILPLTETGQAVYVEAMIAGRGRGSGTDNLGVFLRLPTPTEARAQIGIHLRSD